ncbi:MAG: formyltransferase family protein, partial [Candidatus Nanopelagicales bacterium]
MARARIVVLVSGSGTNLQALIDAAKNADYPAEIAAVGSDRPDCLALRRAEDAGVSTFVLEVGHFQSRDAWDAAFTQQVAEFMPDLVVSAGFMKLAGSDFLKA